MKEQSLPFSIIEESPLLSSIPTETPVGGTTLLSSSNSETPVGGTTLLSSSTTNIDNINNNGTKLQSERPSYEAPPSSIYVNDTVFLERKKHANIKTSSHMPHWQQAGKLQFITFRLADSLPQTVLNSLLNEKEEWLKQQPQPWDEETEKLYKQIFSEKIDKWIDAGYGSCVLNDKAAMSAVVDTLNHFNGEQYHLLAYVVMPNHVHVLVQIFPSYDVSKIVKSWKGVSARMINKRLGLSGELWQKSYFDRIIRNQQHLTRIIAYIEHNYEVAGVALMSPNCK